MAQDVFLNITLDAGVGTTDPSRHKNDIKGGASASGDVTISFDHLKVTNLQTADSIYATIRNRLVASGFK